MRVSTHELFQRSMDNFSYQQEQLNNIQEKITSGKQLLVPSDDPIGIMKALNYHYQINKDDQFVKNAQSAQSQLEYEESILTTVNNIYHRFKELTISAGSGSLSTVDRESIISEMQERLNELVSLANTRTANGNYLFSGYNLTQIPVVHDANGQYQYAGDTGQSTIMLGESTRIAVSDDAKSLFFDVRSHSLETNSVNGRTLITNSQPGLVNSGTLTGIGANSLMINQVMIPVSISDGVSTSDANASAMSLAVAINQKTLQTGVTASANSNVVNLGIFTNGVIAAGEFTINGESIIDLLGTDASIVEAINAKTALTGVTASQPGGTGTNIMLTAADGRNIQLQTDGTAAAATFVNFDLSGLPLNQVQRATINLVSHDAININGAQPTQAGFNYSTTNPSTNTGTGVVNSAYVYDTTANAHSSYSIVFGAGGTTYSIYNDNNPNTPIENFSNKTYVPGQEIAFEGIKVTMSGIMSANDVLSIQVAPETTRSVFETFENIIEKLRSTANDPIRMSYEIGVTLSNINQSEESLLNVRAQIGARLNIVDSQINYHETLKLISQKGLSQVEDLDYSRAITQLSEYTFTLQAAQQSFVKVQSLNLFYFLR